MKRFAYADEKIGDKEVMIAIPSMLIGGGMLTLPNELAKLTNGSDGWILIALGGMITLVVAWLVTKLATSFPNQPFLTYASTITTKPIAILLTCVFGTVGLLITSYVIRNIADTAKEYLFDQTPVEVIALTFLLVVVYAIASSRIGLFRLNMLFFPFLFIIIILLMFFSIQWFEPSNLLPMLQTRPSNYINGIEAVLTSYVGVFVLLFYLAFAEKPKEAPKMIVIGVCMPVILYIAVFIMCIGVFGHAATADLSNPTIELARRAEIPGAVLERMEVVFYVTWMMTIFNTSAMALDIAVLAIQSIFEKVKKMHIIFVITPITYVICMLPQDYVQLAKFGDFVSYFASVATVSITILLLTIAKIRGVKQGE